MSFCDGDALYVDLPVEEDEEEALSSRLGQISGKKTERNAGVENGASEEFSPLRTAGAVTAVKEAHEKRRFLQADRKAKLLPCSHSVCLFCLQQLAALPQVSHRFHRGE